MTDPSQPRPDIPADNGKRRSVAPDGTVHGSGSGAGGGQPGEDFDNDRANGDGYGLTGSEDTDQPE